MNSVSRTVHTGQSGVSPPELGALVTPAKPVLEIINASNAVHIHNGVQRVYGYFPLPRTFAA